MWNQYLSTWTPSMSKKWRQKVRMWCQGLQQWSRQWLQLQDISVTANLHGEFQCTLDSSSNHGWKQTATSRFPAAFSSLARSPTSLVWRVGRRDICSILRDLHFPGLVLFWRVLDTWSLYPRMSWRNCQTSSAYTRTSWSWNSNKFGFFEINLTLVVTLLSVGG